MSIYSQNSIYKNIIDSYYNIERTRGNSLHDLSAFTPSKILSSARKQSISKTAIYIDTLKTRKSTSLKTQTLQFITVNLQSQLQSQKRRIQYIKQSKEFLNTTISPIQIQSKQSLLDYSRLYEISLSHSGDSRKKKVWTSQKSPPKRRSENRFDQTFMKTVNPKFRKQLSLLRRIQIKIQAQQSIFTPFNISIFACIKTLKAIGKSPGNRQGCQIKIVDKKLYVIGGRNLTNLHKLEYLDLTKKQWMSMDICSYQRRSFHSCLMYEGNLLIYGGYKETNTNEIRKLATDLQIINLSTKGIKRIRLPQVFKRSRHSSQIYLPDQLVVTGGFNQNEEFLGDAFKFSLKTRKITKLKFDPEFKNGIARHSMCISDSKVYLFGGMTSSGLSNTLLVYNLLREAFVKVATYGKHPEACFDPNMQYIPKIASIVIYGGLIIKDNNNQYLKQLFQFCQNSGRYTQIESSNTKVLDTFGFYCSGGSLSDGESFYIYGGCNAHEFNEDFYKIDFNY